MRIIIILIISTLAFFGCKTKDHELLGTWFEITESNRAGIVIFDKDSVRFPYGFNGGFNEGYKIQGDKLTFLPFGAKRRYLISNDTLSLIHSEEDSTRFQYVKRKSFNTQDFVKYRYRINLSKIDGAPIYNWHDHDNVIVLKTINSSTDLNINGISHILDSTLFSRIMMKNSVNSIDNLLFVSKNTSVKVLKNLEKELFKARYYQVQYVTINNDSLNKIGQRLPWVEYTLPDSVESNYPPIYAKFTMDIENDLLCEIDRNEIKLNNISVSFDSLKMKILNDMRKEKKPTLVLYYSPNMDYQTYLNYVSEIRKVYYGIRDTFAFETYGIQNYSKLRMERHPFEDEINQSVIKHYPMKMVEVTDYEELLQLKNKIAL